MVDFFHGDVYALPPIGDTPFPIMVTGARATAGITGNWDEHAPVVLTQDQTQTNTAQNNAPWWDPFGDFQKGKALGTSVGNAFADATGIGSVINHALLGMAGIAILAIGAYVLVRD